MIRLGSEGILSKCINGACDEAVFASVLSKSYLRVKIARAFCYLTLDKGPGSAQARYCQHSSSRVPGRSPPSDRHVLTSADLRKLA